MQHKSVSGWTKASEQGVCEAIVSVFGVLDDVGDVVQKGSMRKSLREDRARIRVVDQHNLDSVMSVLGKIVTLREVDRMGLPVEILAKHAEATGGLYAKIKFLLSTPEGAGAFERLKSGAISEWSFAYDVIESHPITVKDETGTDVSARSLDILKIWELSPVIWGANSATATISAKSRRRARPPVDGLLSQLWESKRRQVNQASALAPPGGGHKAAQGVGVADFRMPGSDPHRRRRARSGGW